ncbi:MAG: hypothetical protein IKE94_15080 [Aeriscardovia sp.]|nr:hypothetical protein [Aeriscardovia sp.]MBR2756241.1 hypothetical protein [Lachnospiraceae bacterium]
MKLSLPSAELLDYTRRQMQFFFPDGIDLKGPDVESAFQLALDRIEHCYKAIIHPGYQDENGEPVFYHLHGDHYAQYLWFFGNSLWKLSQNKPLCDKFLLLNRSLFSIFISYKCGLPDYFMLAHAYGTILGNASYNDFLVVSQGVTVNTETDEKGNPAPVLGKGLFLGAHAKIIGREPIGDYVSLGVNAMVVNRMIPDNSVVLFENGDPCSVRLRKKEKCMAQNYFSISF